MMAKRAKARGTWGGRREGAGRPSKLVEPIARWVQIERRDLEAAEQLAAERGISFAELVRRAVRTYLRRHRRA